MRITYDPNADALYIKLKEDKIDESDEIAKGIIIDYDIEQNPVGIEILNASKLFGGKREMKVEMALAEVRK